MSGFADADRRAEHGAHGEALAAVFLELQGWTICRRNTRIAGVEVDLVARLGRDVVLVEVKLRRAGVYPVTAALRPAQRRRLTRAAAALLQAWTWARTVRVELVMVTWQAAARRLTLEVVPDVGLETRTTG